MPVRKHFAYRVTEPVEKKHFCIRKSIKSPALTVTVSSEKDFTRGRH